MDIEDVPLTLAKIALAIDAMPSDLWLDAPTCEGWWWYQPSGSDLEVVQVAARGQSFAVLRAGCEADYGFPAYILSELPAGRWFGPLVPPSVVSGATSQSD